MQCAVLYMEIIIRFIRDSPFWLADKKVVPADDARIVLVSLRHVRYALHRI